MYEMDEMVKRANYWIWVYIIDKASLADYLRDCFPRIDRGPYE